MMKDWHVAGQAIACVVDVSPHMIASFPTIEFPRKGERYTIREVMVGQGVVGLRLKEIVNTKEPTESECGEFILLGECAWIASDFEPIVSRPTSIECFEKIIREVSQRTPILVP